MKESARLLRLDAAYWERMGRWASSRNRSEGRRYFAKARGLRARAARLEKELVFVCEVDESAGLKDEK